MWPGCSHGQNGPYRGSRCQTNVETLASRQNGIQTVAPRHTEGLRVVYDPTLRQNNNGEPSQQRSQPLHRQIRHPNPGYSIWAPQSSCRQFSGHAGPDIHSSLHVIAQRSGVEGDSARHGQREGSFHEGCPQQRPHLNAVFSACTASTTQPGDAVGVDPQPSPLRPQSPWRQPPHPLLNSLLTEGCPDTNVYRNAMFFPSQGTNANAGRSTSANASAQSPCRGRQVNCSLDNLDRERTRAAARNTRRLGEAAHQQRPYSPLPNQPKAPPTDDEILELISKEIENYMRGSAARLNCRAHLSRAPTRDNKAESAGGAAVGHAFPADSSEGSDANADPSQTGGRPTVAPEKRSSEYPQVMRAGANACGENEERPTIASKPGRILDEVPEEDPGYRSQEDCTSPGLNVGKNFSGMDKVCAMTAKETGGKGLKAADKRGVVVLGNGLDAADVSQDVHARPRAVTDGNQKVVLYENEDPTPKTSKNAEDHHCPPTDQGVISHSKFISSLDQIQIHNVMSVANQNVWQWNLGGGEGVTTDAGSVRLQHNASLERSEKHASGRKGVLARAVEIVKQPEYEDITDDEVPPIEDVSEDENPKVENLALEKPFPVPGKRQSPFESEGLSLLRTNISEEKPILKKQSSAMTGPLSIAQCSDEGLGTPLSPKCDGEGHAGWPASRVHDAPGHGPGGGGDGEKQGAAVPVHPERHCPKAASASCQIEVFDTVVSFLRAKAGPSGGRSEGASGRDAPRHVMGSDADGEPSAPPNQTASLADPEDGSETDDSCDYSSGSERNYLTVSGCVLKKRPARPTPGRGHSELGRGDQEKVTHVQIGHSKSSETLRCMEKLKEFIQARAKSTLVQPDGNGPTFSTNQDVIYLGSYKEDENKKNCRRKAKREGSSFSSGSVDDGDALAAPHSGFPPETVKEVTCLPAPQHERRGAQEDCAEPPAGTRKTGQPIEIESSSGRDRHAARNSPAGSVIILSSDTESDSDQNPQGESEPCFISSGSVDSGSVACVPQTAHLSLTLEGKWGAAREKLQRTCSSSDLSVSQHGSEPRGAQVNQVLQDACPDLSNRVKNGAPPIQSEDCVDFVQGKRDRRETSKKRVSWETSDEAAKNDDPRSKTKATAERSRPSVSRDNGAAFFALQNRRSTETGLSGSEPQSVNKASAPSPSSSIPRLAFGRPSAPGDPLQLSNIHEEGTEEAAAPKIPAATGKNDAQNLRPKKVQASATRPKLASRQLSLPNLGSFNSSSSVPKQNASPLQPPQSCSAHHPTVGRPLDAPMQRSARQQVKNDWNRSYFPTRRDRRSGSGTEETSRVPQPEPRRDARPGPSHRDGAPRQRHSSKDPETSLMKRSKIEAVQWSKAINRDAQGEKSCFVGAGYKWAVKPKVVMPYKGTRKRHRSPERDYYESYE